MSDLRSQFRPYFTASVRQRGERIVDDVDLQQTEPFPIRAFVAGTSIYDVQIDPRWDDAGHCTCAAYENYGPCKHMWATLCALANRQQRQVGAQTGMRELGEEIERQLGSGLRRLAQAAPEGRRAELFARLQRVVGGAGASASRPVGGPDREAQRLREMLREAAARRLGKVRHGPLEMREVRFHVMPYRRGARTGAEFDRDAVTLEPALFHRLSNGNWSVPKPGAFEYVFENYDSEDPRRALAQRVSWFQVDTWSGEFEICEVPDAMANELVQGLAAAGVLYSGGYVASPRRKFENATRIELSDAVVHLDVELDDTGDTTAELVVTARCGETEFSLDDVHAFLGDRHLVTRETHHRWESNAPRELVWSLLEGGPLVVSSDQAGSLRQLVDPEDSPVPRAVPVPIYRLDESFDTSSGQRLLRGRLTFGYGHNGRRAEVCGSHTDPQIDIDGGAVVRDVEAEAAAIDTFIRAGGVVHGEWGDTLLSVNARDAADLVRTILAAGFEVWAGHEPVRSYSSTSVRVASNEDWFELEASVSDEAGDVVAVPELLSKLDGPSAGFVRLGAKGWAWIDDELAAFASLSHLGKEVDGKLKVRKSQAFLLDAILQSRSIQVAADREFAKVRATASAGLSPAPRREPRGFGAELRDYQREGLGWFEFLRKLGVGGCLADDMGLGKTVQVLALLEQQRRRRPRPGPSLVVAPRSLVFHWEREAERFAPKLRIAPFVGPDRWERFGSEFEENFSARDLVLTTYGTLRRDIDRMGELEWNYLVLDEAQAIKNERSQASKSVRACRAEHRLALSGTPIENHLGELWSLFEFLNPGMLGASATFRKLVRAGGDGLSAGGPRADGDSADTANSTTAAIRRAVRPFLLRRTKSQVLAELPDKSVQVVECEMPKPQKKAYDELAKFYRAKFGGELDEGVVPDRMRFHVLEALLRLRQVACHPGLVDSDRGGEDAAKFEVLMPMLEDLRSEGHKALIFSQFPSLLRLLRDRLDEQGVDYAYLDGRTRKREAQVEKFQSDPNCSLFLISIKAGGHGLNLTAARYVFLLDPWWNPAVESQAMDRAHRIGQTANVHVYRLLCRGTVEEKVAALQDRKQALADAVLGDDESVLQGLTGADVAALLA